MEAAVREFVERKFGPQGVFRGGARGSGWQEPYEKTAGIPAPTQAAIETTIAYCEYVHGRYGRFPANSGPFRTVLAHQAHHLDPDFYDRFYRPETLTDAHRHDHGGA
jgi:hypothetical protein